MGKRRKASGKRPTADADVERYHISAKAIMHSTGIGIEEDLEDPKEIARHIYRTDEDNFWEVVVVTLDMRKSSTALVHVEDYEEYSNVLKDYICYVSERCKRVYDSQIELRDKDLNRLPIKERGWFDKFTGDGVLLFWRLPQEPEWDVPYYNHKSRTDTKDSYDKKLKEQALRWNLAIRRAVEFSIEVVAQFLETALPEFRKTCGCLPVDFGISAGIDAGECLLTAIEPSDEFDERYKRYGLHKSEEVSASQNVTAIGRPVIGASRMVEAARPYEILVKSYPGGALSARLEDPKDKVGKEIKFCLKRVAVEIKEGEKVEAYRVVSGRIEQLKKTMTLIDDHRDKSMVAGHEEEQKLDNNSTKHSGK